MLSSARPAIHLHSFFLVLSKYRKHPYLFCPHSRALNQNLSELPNPIPTPNPPLYFYPQTYCHYNIIQRETTNEKIEKWKNNFALL